MLRVSLSDSWFLPGMKGSGKTTLAQRGIAELRKLYPFAPIYVLDSKNAGEFESWPGRIEDDDPPDALLEPGGIQVWSPSIDDLGAYNEWLGRLLKTGYEIRTSDGKRRRPKVVLIDELSSICKSSGDGVLNFDRLLKQARSLWISPWILSQQATVIPKPVKSQATHLARFRLNDDTGDRVLDGLMQGNQRPKKQHGFIYCRLDGPSREPTEYGGWQEFLGYGK